MNYDEMKGGAISSNVRFLEGLAPEPKKDYRAVWPDESFLYDGPKWTFFQDAFDYRPLNIQPMYAYEGILQSKNEAFTKDILKQGLSGLGARKDDTEIRTATAHTLKRHPQLLQLYMNGSL